MSLKAREYDAKVARVVYDAGARIVSKGHDGSGHRTVTICHHGQERTFHYPSTGTSHGHGLRNMQQRLKWLIDEIKPLPVVETKEAAAQPAVPRHAELPATTLTKKNPRPKASRSEIRKRYIEAGSIDTIMQEFNLTFEQAEVILLSTAGAIRTAYEKERNKNRAAMARKVKPPVLNATTEAFIPSPVDTIPQRKEDKDKDKRDRRIYVYYYYGMAIKEVAEHFGLTHERVRQIVRAMEKLHDAG